MTGQNPPLFSEATRRYVLGTLVVVYTFNFIDRQILSILLEPIKQESLRYSLLICSFVNVCAAAHYYLAGKYLADDLAAAARDST